MKCIILAGGSGDSLWPLSRKNYPKQFISNQNSLSIFQEIITRNIPFCDEFIIITNKKYEIIVSGQMQTFQGINYKIILEERGLGTAGAIAFVTQIFDKEETVMILPSDFIFGQDGYSDAVYKGKKIAEENRIAIFGVVPDNANTNYGYIQYNDSKVTRFISKVSDKLADKLFWQDNILWNCGVAIGKISVLINEFKLYNTASIKQAELLYARTLLSKYGNMLIPKQEGIIRDSFEKKILEQSELLSVVKIHCPWTDLSDFSSYREMYNVNDELVIQNECNNTTVINRSEGKLVVTNNLENVLVVNTEDAVYITDKEEIGKVCNIINANYESKKHFFRDSPLVYRPWGTREVIQSSTGYRVRKIIIYPGMKLSEHIHENRNENYSVVSGELTIVLDDETKILRQGDSYNVLPGMNHKLCNNSDDNVIVIEVDTGLLIDESDMIHPDEITESIPSIFKMEPAYKDYLWGGDTLSNLFGKNTPYEITAESWELSAHKDGTSIISGGPMDRMSFDQFIHMYGEKACGWKSKTFDRFPILIKFIDARNALSVQIHPYDDYAFANENEFGKNEMWYVMDCKPGSYLYCGLKEKVSEEEIRERIANETLTEILNKIEVKKGDVVYVPAGTIHAIGAGILICEIQQNSNSTYRMFDYGRRDKNGNLRDLHIDKALDVVNTEAYYPDITGFSEPVVTEGSVQQVLSRCKYFEVTKYKITEHEIIGMDDSSFKSLVLLSGNCKIRCGEETQEAKAGDSFFVTAGRKRIHIYGNCEIIVTNV